MSSIRDDYDAITVARRRERTLWLWTVIAAVFAADDLGGKGDE